MNDLQYAVPSGMNVLVSRLFADRDGGSLGQRRGYRLVTAASLSEQTIDAQCLSLVTLLVSLADELSEWGLSLFAEIPAVFRGVATLKFAGSSQPVYRKGVSLQKRLMYQTIISCHARVFRAGLSFLWPTAFSSSLEIPSH